MSQTRRQKIEAGLRLKIKNLKHDVAAREQTNQQLKKENRKLKVEIKRLKAKLPPEEDE